MVGLRAVRLAVTLFVVTLAAALMIDLLPGDPALHILGADYQTTADQVELVRERMGLNDPIHVRYWNWVSGAVQGDLGWSYARRQPASQAILQRLPVTVQLMVFAQVLALLIALVVAPLAALRRNSVFDQASSTASFALLSLPHFILGLLLMYLFAVTLGWLPSTGFVPIRDGLIANLRSLLLPALTLAAAEAAVYTRLLRSEMVNTLQEDYIALARAKGLSEWWIMVRHVLRPSSFSLMTVAGLSIGGLIGGAVIVETLFSLPGIGRLAVDSITSRDFVVVQGIVALVTIAYVGINFLVDLLYMVLDPRIRGARV
jgi:peptide/nickel transport system permease protein